MQTLLLQPHLLLAPYVRSILVIEQPDTRAVTPLPYFADGCPGLIYQQASGGACINGDKKLPPLFAYGQTVKPIVITACGQFRMIIFFFYPHVIKSLFRINSKEITDDCFDIAMVPLASHMSIIERLQHATSAAAQAGLIEQFLRQLLYINNAPLESRVHFAVQQIMGSKGHHNIRDIRNEMNISERTFERLFEQHVGVAPKLFSRIIQFQSSLHQVGSKDYELLTDVAFDNGYTDQSHFIRAFKEFTGLTPLEFKKQPASDNNE